MTFSRIRASGGWSSGSIDPAELETLDSYVASAIDGDTGGTYAPTSVLEIGGAGLQVSADSSLTVDGALTHTNTSVAAIFQAALFHKGVLMEMALTVGGTLTANACTITDCDFSGDVTAAGSFDVSGDASFGGVTAVSGSLTTLDAVTLAIPSGKQFTLKKPGGTTVLNVSETYGLVMPDVLSLTGQGRIRWRVAHGLDADHTYSVLDADIVMVPGANTLTADRIWIIADPASGEDFDGVTMQISLAGDGTSHLVSVKTAGGALITTLSGNGAQTSTPLVLFFPTSCTLVRDGGVWKVLHQQTFVPT